MIYDVTAYGADPTGAADSSTAIQQANDAAAAAAVKGIVYYPPGTYLLKGVNAKADQVSHGGATLKLAAVAGEANAIWMFHVSTPRIRFRNLRFDGNRASQPTPAYTQNYRGFHYGTLIQALDMFEECSIEGCVFENTAYGVLYARDIDRATGAPNGTTAARYLGIKNCRFYDIGTVLVEAANPYQAPAVTTDAGGNLYFTGAFEFTGNVAEKVGTVTAPLEGSGITDQGEGLIVDYFYSIRCHGNTIKECVRFDYKIGAFNHFSAVGNTSVLPKWGMFQHQTTPLHATANNLVGHSLIADNTFVADPTSVFCQAKGSADVQGLVHAYLPVLKITGNALRYRTGTPATVVDAIQVSGLYEDVSVEDNTALNVWRALVSVAFPAKPGFTPKRLAVRGNSLEGRGATVTGSSVAYLQGGGDYYRTVEVVGNSTRGTVHGLFVSASCDTLVVADNLFRTPTNGAVYVNAATPPTASLITGNLFEGAVTGLGGATLWRDNHFRSLTDQKNSGRPTGVGPAYSLPYAATSATLPVPAAAYEVWMLGSAAKPVWWDGTNWRDFAGAIVV